MSKKSEMVHLVKCKQKQHKMTTSSLFQPVSVVTNNTQWCWDIIHNIYLSNCSQYLNYGYCSRTHVTSIGRQKSFGHNDDQTGKVPKHRQLREYSFQKQSRTGLIDVLWTRSFTARLKWERHQRWFRLAWTIPTFIIR